MWKLGKKNGREWLWNFEHEEKMHYEKHQLSKGEYTMINDDPIQKLELY